MFFFNFLIPFSSYVFLYFFIYTAGVLSFQIQKISTINTGKLIANNNIYRSQSISKTVLSSSVTLGDAEADKNRGIIKVRYARTFYSTENPPYEEFFFKLISVIRSNISFWDVIVTFSGVTGVNVRTYVTVCSEYKNIIQ